LSGAVDAFDAAQFNVRCSGRARDKRDRSPVAANEVSKVSDGFGNGLDDLGAPHDADVKIGHERELSRPFALAVGHDEGSRLGNGNGACRDDGVDLVKLE
jgi:hypothetical protein